MEEAGEFLLFLYAVPESTQSVPTPESIQDWLSSVAQILGEPIPLEQGECYTFFKAIHLVTGVDLLPLIGSTVDEPSCDEEYCSGTVSPEAINEFKVAVANLDKTKLACAQYLQAQGVSEEWFLDCLNKLNEQMGIAGTETRIFGYFE